MNGEVECFSGSHIALALLAILVLLGAVLLLPFILLVTTGKLTHVSILFKAHQMHAHNIIVLFIRSMA